MKKLILAGGGHGHIGILKKLALKPVDGYEITMITNFAVQYYSGMLPGYIEGIYTKEEISFDVQELCKKAGVKYINDNIKEIDRDKKLVITKNVEHHYDFLSMNLGLSSREDFEINGENCTYVKPISALVSFKTVIENDKAENKKMIIIGAGVSGIELAFAYKERFPNLNIQILGKNNDILPNFNPKFREKIKKLLKEKTITLSLTSKCQNIGTNSLKTNEETLEYDYLILANGYTGVEVKYKGFETTKDNYLIVDDCLMAGDGSLAMGDMISLKSHKNLVKAGVFAIRQAPVLYHNLLKTLDGKTDYKTYTPQEKYLQIINAGGKKALMAIGDTAIYGKIPWIIKDYIDRKYMGK